MKNVKLLLLILLPGSLVLAKKAGVNEVKIVNQTDIALKCRVVSQRKKGALKEIIRSGNRLFHWGPGYKGGKFDNAPIINCELNSKDWVVEDGIEIATEYLQDGNTFTIYDDGLVKKIGDYIPKVLYVVKLAKGQRAPRPRFGQTHPTTGVIMRYAISPR